jgi:hypothetical protein
MVASAENGECVIAATWEEGELKDEMVKNVVSAVSQRLKALA